MADASVQSETVVTAPGDLFRDPPQQLAAKQKISEAFASLPPDKKTALLVVADLSGEASASLVTKLGEHWSFVAGATYQLKDKRPAGYVALEASF